MEVKKVKGFGECKDCGWYMIPKGCNVERDSAICLKNKCPSKEAKITAI